MMARSVLTRKVLLMISFVMAVCGFAILNGSEPAFAVGKVTLSKKAVTMQTADKTTLSVKNAKAAKKTVKWTSSDKKIVVVTKKTGKYHQAVTLKAGKKTGTAWVFAKVGKKSLKCRVTVKAQKLVPVEGPSKEPEKEPEILPLSSDAAEVTTDQTYTPATATDSSAAFDQAYTAFALQLLQTTLKEDAAADNVLVSPDSVMTALTMTENGAVGETQKQMHQVLTGGSASGSDALGGGDAPKGGSASGGDALGSKASTGDPAETGSAPSVEELNDYLWRLHSRLTGSKDLIYNCSNSIWTKRDLIVPAADFLSTNKKYHNASFYESSFGKQGAEDMNRWVYNNTRNMIDQIIDPNEGLSEDARMVLLNAIAFEGKWKEQFQDSQVRKNEIFTPAKGEPQKVTMLRGTEYTYLEAADGTGFAKPYEGGQIAFLGLLPPKGMSARDYVASLTGKDLQKAWQQRKTGTPVRILLPCFKYDYGISMKTVLQNMGMILPFTGGADFSAMMDPSSPEYEDGLHIDDVLHKTHIELDQNGTKAAAVTAVIMEKNTSIPTHDAKAVILDRPFAYALVDTQTGDPLFLGIVESIK